MSTSPIIIASGNAKKIREMNELLIKFNLQAISQQEFGITDAEETGLTFMENALLKARHAAKQTGKPAIADDSGLCVPALGGAPGIYSARYSGKHGDDKANNDKLLQNLSNLEKRNAYYVCAIAYLHHPEDPLPILAQGLWYGEILLDGRGTNGFGYDPLFYIPQLGKSAAEMEAKEKNRISHRALALANFAQQYSERYSSFK